MNCRKFCQWVGLVSLVSVPTRAIITGGGVTGGSSLSTGGTFIELSVPFTPPAGAPNTVGQNTFQTPHLYGFNEDQNVLVGPGNLAVNIGSTIAAGTEVASHYIFFDPNGTTSQEGYVDFDADILAVLTSTTLLAASDYLANTGVTYLNPGLRGLEAGDSVGIDPGNSKRLLVDWTASSPGDYVRVLTKFSPGAETVPDGGATVGLLALGSMGLFWASRRRQ